MAEPTDGSGGAHGQQAVGSVPWQWAGASPRAVLSPPARMLQTVRSLLGSVGEKRSAAVSASVAEQPPRLSRAQSEALVLSRAHSRSHNEAFVLSRTQSEAIAEDDLEHTPVAADRLLGACLRLLERERRRKHVYRAFFDAWRSLSNGPERQIQKLSAELAYWRRSLDGARQVIDEQQRKIGEQALRISSLEKDHSVLTAEGRSHAFVEVVDEQTRAIGALQLQVAAMARVELNSRKEERSRQLARTLAEQARLLLLAMRDRERRLEAEAKAHKAAIVETVLRRAFAEEKNVLEDRRARAFSPTSYSTPASHSPVLHLPPLPQQPISRAASANGDGEAAEVAHRQGERAINGARMVHNRSRSLGTMGDRLSQLNAELEARGSGRASTPTGLGVDGLK
ncbi:hypothetical protein T492DRAFT_1049142 [Pavlovales sp. CCMP2436]|nr:hypothetical protein T492DRAFT_1049142 [Pavlovales sp. CCMP2436]